MDIVLIAQYLRNIDDFTDNNSRFVYLAKLLKKSHEVEIITSDFIHGSKTHVQNVGQLENVKVTVLHEPGYPQNVCFKRFSSHRALAKNIQKYLESRKTPDVVYVAVPSLAVADTAAMYCKKTGAKFIVDIQDLWPEAFKMVLNIPVISNIIFFPMKHQANRIYANADEIISVSKTYADRGMSVNGKCDNATVVYLGTKKETFDRYAKAPEPEQFQRMSNKNYLPDGASGEKIRIAYCGTLGNSYDLNVVFRALRLLNKKDINKLQFIVMGNGQKREIFEKEADGLPAFFTGNLPYPEMVWLLYRCDIAVNPIRKGSAQSIINKHMDYAMAGLPVINTQECQEYRDLLDEYQAGINCRCENVEDVAAAIRTLISASQLRLAMGANSRRMGEEKFDRGTAYKAICNLVVK